VPEFSGLKLTQDAGAAVAFRDVHKIELRRKCADILVDAPGLIASGSPSGGGNSGFQALNIAVQFGATRIVLVGFDMRLDRGLHWHGRHPQGLNNPHEPSIMAWRRALDAAAPTFAALGITVLNASPVSALTAYPVVPLEDSIRCSSPSSPRQRSRSRSPRPSSIAARPRMATTMP
jgi:hypothetical protein